MAPLGSLLLRDGWLRRFSPTGRTKEPIPFFCFAPICSEVPGPVFCALGWPCPPLRFEEPRKPGPWKYLRGPKTAWTPAVVSDLRNQNAPADLLVSIARAKTKLDWGHSLRHRKSVRECCDHLR